MQDNHSCKIRRSEMSVFFYPNYRRKGLITWQYSEWKKTGTTPLCQTTTCAILTFP